MQVVNASSASTCTPVCRITQSTQRGQLRSPAVMRTMFLGSEVTLRPIRFDSRDTVTGSRVTQRNLTVSVRAAKKGKKGGKGGAGGAPNYKSPGKVKEGSAYAQETRRIILSMNRVSKVAPNGKQILKNVGLQMYLGAKIGILGANGAGKSSVLRILAGVDKDIDGEVVLEDGIKVGYLEQEPTLDDGETVDENIAPGLKAIQDLVEEYEGIGYKMAEPDADMDALMARMDALQTQIDACNGWELDRIKERAMDALRCPPGDAKVAVLSGGERRRVALCRLLLASPDILLLDEPTNHLDAQSVAWLERFLAEFPGTVVAVTHDRYFLDNVAGWILELDRGQGIPFEGNYSQWLESKDKRLDAESKTSSSLQKAIREELEWINKNAKGQQKKGKARLKRYDELMDEAASFTQASSMDSIVIPVPSRRLGDVVIQADAVSKGYGDRLLLDGLSFNIPPGACVGIVGANGAGKSTLFRMITGDEEPDSGALQVGETVQLMCTDQGRAELDPDQTVYEAICDGADEVVVGGRAVNARAYCSWYNFKGADQQKKVSVLSGGERNRVQLAKVLKSGGNLLMLDEPTNDLDVETLRALEQALSNFAGSSIIISHDRWFLDRLATHIMAYEGDSKVVWFEGSYSEYAQDLQQRTGSADPTRIKYKPLATVG